MPVRSWIGIIAAVALGATSARADRASSYYHQAMAYKRQGQIPQAIEALDKALMERKDYAAAHLSLGILHRQQGRNQEAIIHLERAVELEPKAAGAHYSLGLAYFGAGRKDDAIAALERAAKLDPKDPQATAQLGVLLLRSDPERAVSVLHQAVKLDASADNLHQLGLAYRRSAAVAASKKQSAESERRMKQAEAYLQRAARLKDTPELHFDLGVLYRRTNQLQKAVTHYRRAVAGDPKLAAAWWDLGHVYTQLNADEEAIIAFERYIALNPRGKDTSIAKDRIEVLKTGRPGKKSKP